MDEQFFKTFEKINKKEWLEKATNDLKGENPYEKFAWEIEPGISVKPYYDQDTLPENTSKFNNRLLALDDPSGDLRHWDNLQQIVVSNTKEANEEALQALKGGADGICFDMRAINGFDLKELLADIQLSHCSVGFLINNSNHLQNIQVLENFHQLLIYCEDDQICIEALNEFKDTKRVKVTSIEKPPIHFTDKIVQLLIQANRLLTTVSDEGLDATPFFKKYALQYTLGTDFFGELAALRALRLLYFQMVRAYGVEDFNPEDVYITAISSAWSNETYNPHANMLKSTTAGMAAILGGCNGLVIEPENSKNKMMCRIARNVSHILKEESFLNSSVDPAAGAYYIEALTDQLAQAAWKKFQQQTSTQA